MCASGFNLRSGQLEGVPVLCNANFDEIHISRHLNMEERPSTLHPTFCPLSFVLLLPYTSPTVGNNAPNFLASLLDQSTYHGVCQSLPSSAVIIFVLLPNAFFPCLSSLFMNNVKSGDRILNQIQNQDSVLP
jgi:hypothetical protein